MRILCIFTSYTFTLMNFKYLPHLNSGQNLSDGECPLVRDFTVYVNIFRTLYVSLLWFYDIMAIRPGYEEIVFWFERPSLMRFEWPPVDLRSRLYGAFPGGLYPLRKLTPTAVSFTGPGTIPKRTRRPCKRVYLYTAYLYIHKSFSNQTAVFFLYHYSLSSYTNVEQDYW